MTDDVVAPDAEDTTAPKRGRGRATVSILLAVLGGVLLPLAGITVWTRNQLLDTDRYVETVAPLATDPAIQEAASARLTKTVTDAVDLKQVAEDALPEQAQVLAGPIASGADQLVGRLSDRIVQSDKFQTLWDDANRAGHNTVVAALTGEGTKSIETDNGQVVLKFGPLAKQVLQGLDKETGLDLESKVPAEKLNVSFVLVQSDDLAQIQSAVRWLNRLTWIIAIAAIACLIGAVFAATDRRRGVRRAGWAVTISSAVMLAGFAVARSQYLGSLPDEVSQPAASAAYDILVRNLRMGFRVIGIIGIILLIGSLIRLPSRHGDPGPVSVWIAAHIAAVRTTILVVAAGALLLLDQPAVASVVTIIVLAAVLLGIAELFHRAGSGGDVAPTDAAA